GRGGGLRGGPDGAGKWLAGRDDETRACVFCPYCEHEDQHHRVVTCTLWPKPVDDHRKRLTPGVWRPDRPEGMDEPFRAALVAEAGARGRGGARWSGSPGRRGSPPSAPPRSPPPKARPRPRAPP